MEKEKLKYLKRYLDNKTTCAHEERKDVTYQSVQKIKPSKQQNQKVSGLQLDSIIQLSL